MACDCDGEDLWHDWPFNLDCTHECEDEDDDLYLDDNAWSKESNRPVGRFELRIEDGRRFWWGSENGWKDATEIGENGVLTLDAAAFAIGTVLTLTEPTEEPMNPLAEKLGISIEKAGVWRITPDGLERIEEQPVIRCEAINPRWTGKPRRKWKLRRKRGGIA